jgi:hypothetical protein
MLRFYIRYIDGFNGSLSSSDCISGVANLTAHLGQGFKDALSTQQMVYVQGGSSVDIMTGCGLEDRGSIPGMNSSLFILYSRHKNAKQTFSLYLK